MSKVVQFIKHPRKHFAEGAFHGDYAISAFLEEENGFVYFIQIGEFGPIKIGFSNDPHKRLNDLQVANPYPLRILYYRKESEKTEKLLHERFSDLNISGEWFHPHKYILECIDEFKEWDFKDDAYRIKSEKKYASGEWKRPMDHPRFTPRNCKSCSPLASRIR